MDAVHLFTETSCLVSCFYLCVFWVSALPNFNVIHISDFQVRHLLYKTLSSSSHVKLDSTILDTCCFHAVRCLKSCTTWDVSNFSMSNWNDGQKKGAISSGSCWMGAQPTEMDVSENSGTPKSSILIGFSIINHPFWGTPIFGNTQMLNRLLAIIGHPKEAVKPGSLQEVVEPTKDPRILQSRGYWKFIMWATAKTQWHSLTFQFTCWLLNIDSFTVDRLLSSWKRLRAFGLLPLVVSTDSCYHGNRAGRPQRDEPYNEIMSHIEPPVFPPYHNAFRNSFPKLLDSQFSTIIFT